MTTLRSKPSFHILIVFALLAFLLGSSLGVTPAYAATVTVTKTADTNDGVCDGDCSLREAIATAGVGDTIIFDSSLSGGTIYLTSLLTLAQNVTIDGSALATQITISGDSDNNGTGDVGVFSVSSGVTATLDSLTITKGSATVGGGIFNASGGALTVTNSTLSGNTTTGGPGGGIKNDGTLTVTNSTFSANSAVGGSGGGIRNAGALTVTNSTFSANTTTGSGGGIYNLGSFTLTVRNSTFSANAAASQGGGIYYSGGTLNYANTIIANSTSGGDCAGSGTIGTNTDNLVEDASCSASLSGDPSLGALAGNGGPTQTFALLTDSAAIDAGDNTTCAASPVSNLDQRGVTRPVDGNGDTTATCDIGAYEAPFADTTKPTVDSFSATSPSTSLNVPITAFTASDGIGVTGYLITESSTPPSAGSGSWAGSAPSTYTVGSLGTYSLYPWAKDAAGNVSSVYGSPAAVTVCSSSITVTSSTDSGAGTLRQAITDACAGGTIDFDSGLSGATIYLASTLTLVQDVTIDGSALATQITISGDTDNDGTGNVGVFSVNSGVTATLDSLTITKGSATVGGGIFNASGGTLTVTNSTLSGNTTTGGPGGGIKNDGTLTVTNSTFSANSAVGGSGGGIRNAGALTVTNSTFSGNTTTGSGGGIYNLGSFTLTVRNSTFSANAAASQGGGIYYSGGTLNYANTIIANSTSGGDCAGSGAIGTNTNNLVEDASCSASQSGDPGLGSLADNGGPTQTFALGVGSSAIDAGDDTTCAAAPVSNLDQRGVARPVGAHCDIGAFEGSKDISMPTVTSFSATTPSSSLAIPITAFAASDNVAVSGYKITESSTPPSAGAGGWTASAPTTYSVGSDGSYTLYPWAKDAAGNVSSVFGSPLGVTVDTSAPILNSFTATTPSSSLNIPITAFTASDNMAVTGYKITEAATPPAAGAAGWSGTAPTIYTVGSEGSYTLYPWAKDATGHVSPVFSSPASVSVDTTAPTVTSFTATSSSASLTIPITAFTASDVVGVTGYKITESATPPAAGAAGWSGTAPTIYTVGSEGSYTLYPWAKDATGHVSLVFGSPASVSVDTSMPTVVSSVRANLDPSAAASVDFIVTFSESVTGVDSTDFSLTTTGSISGAVVSGVSGSGTTYTVTVNTGSGSGTIRLDVADNGTIVDATSNPLGGSGAGNGAFTSGEAYTIHLYRIYLPFVMRNE